MADDNPFAGLADTSDAGGLRQEPLSTNERLILQNFFDTQPKRRAAYLKQIGFEMDQKDNNKIRPLGSPGSFDIEIDPGFSAYFKKGGLKEFGKDIADLQTDLLKGEAIVGGAAVGAAAGAPGGPLALLGAVIGGGLGSAASEGVKKVLGDTLLDESVPMDKRILIVGSLIDGVVPQAVKEGGGRLVRGALDSKLLASKNAAIQALKGSGGVANAEVIDYAVKNPEKFTPEAVKGANKAYIDTFKGFFGLEPEQFSKEVTDFNRIPTESIFGKQIAPLKQAAQGEVAKLTANPNASVNGGMLLSQLNSTIEELSAKPFRSEIEENALKTAKSLADDVLKGAKQITGNKKLTTGELSSVSFNYGQARDLLKKVQEKAFDVGQFGSKTENPIIANIAGRARRGLDEVAAANGSQLPQLNAAQSEVLSTFRKAQTQLNPEKLFQAYTGNSKVASQEIRDFITNEVDSKFGTQWAPEFEDAAVKKYFEGVFKNTAAKGSRELQAEMAAEAAKQAKVGAIAGIGTGGAIGGAVGGLPGAGIGSALGGAIGGGAGALRGRAQAALAANPELALQTVAQINQKLSQPASQGFENAISAAIAPQVSREATELLPRKEDDNPFAGLGD